MTEFEYLSVFVSIIIGLGVAHILSGVARTVYNRSRWKFDTVHLIWTASTFQVLVLNWWVFFRSRDVAEWTFGGFVLVVTWAVIFYLLAVVLYPQELEQGENYGDVFERNRVWFLALWIASNFCDIALTWWRGGVFDPPEYLPFVIHFILLGIAAIVFSNRRFQVFVAGWIWAVSLAWAFGVRRLLTG